MMVFVCCMIVVIHAFLCINLKISQSNKENIEFIKRKLISHDQNCSSILNELNNK